MLVSKTQDKRSDEELILLYRQQYDLSVLGILYQRYMSLVYGVCVKYLKNRDESKDAVMQIFEKLVETLKTHDISHFKSWLYVTSRNFCLMQLRAGKNRYFEEISDDLMEPGIEMHLDDDGPETADLGKLENCIEQLGNEQKWCVQLFYLQQKCYKEITEVTGFDDKKVKSYIQNGKRNLKICMERNG